MLYSFLVCISPRLSIMFLLVFFDLLITVVLLVEDHKRRFHSNLVHVYFQTLELTFLLCSGDFSPSWPDKHEWCVFYRWLDFILACGWDIQVFFNSMFMKKVFMKKG